MTVKPKSQLQDIAYSLVDQFNSRTNDYGGYWGLGVLYRYAKSRGMDTITLDLVQGTITPEDDLHIKIAQMFRTRLLKHLRTRSLPVNWISSAQVIVRFNDDTGAKKIRSSCGDPYVVEVVLQSISGCKRSSVKTGYCWPHDENRENKRWDSIVSRLNLVGDGDDVDFIEQIEATFKVEFTEKETMKWHTVGDVYESLLQKHLADPQEEVVREKCMTHRSFNMTRTVLQSLTNDKITPEASFHALGLDNHKIITRAIEAEHGLMTPQLAITGLHIGLSACFAIICMAIIGYNNWPFWWIIGLIPIILWLMIKLPAQYEGAVGDFSNDLAALNHGYFAEMGFLYDDGTIWRSLQTVCNDYVSLMPHQEIGRDTFLLAK